MMRARTGLIFAAVAVLSGPMAAQAEPVSPYFYAGPVGGYATFRDALQLKDNLYVGGRLGYQMAPWLGIEVAGGYVPTQLDTPAEPDLNFWHASGNIVLSPWTGPHVTPYVFVGGGYDQFKFKEESDTDLYLGDEDDIHYGTGEFGAGVRFWFNDMLGLVVEGRGIADIPKEDWLKTAKLDVIVASAGITLAFGGAPSDADGDGVSDRKDKCPGTPAGATVDAAGCPLDSDGDGVFDGLDRCAGTPKGATVDARGCPLDGDGDGVYDGLDQCAGTPKGATVDATGCPSDSDGDGVYDGLDQCADTPKGATVDATGCPSDSDGDGVYDGLDKCPDTPAGLKVDADGCPPSPVRQRETELLDTGLIRLHDINFETAKAEILPESRQALDVVGEVLSKWPQLKVEIGGHCDSRGSDAYNLALSRRRVSSVRTYLLQHFKKLEAAQLVAKGYGESQPLVQNTSPENMAQNRRVEFKVLNTAVLKQLKP